MVDGHLTVELARDPGQMRPLAGEQCLDVVAVDPSQGQEAIDPGDRHDPAAGGAHAGDVGHRSRRPWADPCRHHRDLTQGQACSLCQDTTVGRLPAGPMGGHGAGQDDPRREAGPQRQEPEPGDGDGDCACCMRSR